MNHPEKGDVLVRLGDPVFTQYCLVGRRTFVYKAVFTPPLVEDVPMIVKFSYQVTTRKPEQELVDHARKAGVKHLPQIHAWADLLEFKDIARPVYRLEELRAARDKKTISVPSCEDRVFRAVVYTEYGSIKPLIAEYPALLPTVIHQVIECA